MTSKYGLLFKTVLDPESERYQEIVSVNAYFKAEKRGFEPGHDIKDWLEAESEIRFHYCTPQNASG